MKDAAAMLFRVMFGAKKESVFKSSMLDVDGYGWGIYNHIEVISHEDGME